MPHSAEFFTHFISLQKYNSPYYSNNLLFLKKFSITSPTTATKRSKQTMLKIVTYGYKVNTHYSNYRLMLKHLAFRLQRRAL